MANPWGLNTTFNPGLEDAQPNLISIGANPVAPALPVRPQNKNEKNSIQKNGVKSNIYLDPEENNTQLEGLLGSSGLSGQAQGVNDMQNLLDMRAKGLAGVNQTDLRPLAAIADFENAKYGNKSNLVDTISPPADVVNKMLGYQKVVQDQKESLAKNLIEGQKNLKAGTESDFNENIIKALTANGFGGSGMGGINSPERMYLQQTNRIKGDLLQNKLFTQTSNLSNAISNLVSSEKQTPVTLAELNDVVNSNMGISGSTTGKERDALTQKNYGVDWATLQGYLSEPKSVPGGLKNPIIRTLIDRASLELENKKAQAAAQAEMSFSGLDTLVQMNPEFQTGFNQIKKSQMDRLELPEKTKKAIENIMNKNKANNTPVHQMSEAEIDAELARLKGTK